MEPAALIEKLDSGDVSNIVQAVEVTLSGKGKSAVAFRAITRISNLCLNTRGRNDPALTDDEALRLALLCAKAIRTDSEGLPSLPANCRAITSVSNLLINFNGKRNTVSAVKTLEGFLPIFKKMQTSKEERDALLKCVVATRNIIQYLNDTYYNENADNEYSLLDLLNLMLNISSLVSAEESIHHIFFVMMRMSRRYESYHKSSSTEKVVHFNKILVETYLSFFEVAPTQFTGDENAADNFFSVFISALWQFLQAGVVSGSVSSVHHILASISKFITSFLRKHSYYIRCFDIIARILKSFCFENNALPEEKTFANEIQYFINTLAATKETRLSPAFTWILYIAGCVVSHLEKQSSGFKNMKSLLTSEVLISFHQFTKLLSELLLLCDHGICTDANGQTCPFKGNAVLAFRTASSFITLSVELKKECKDGLADLLPSIQESIIHQQSIVDKAVDGKCVKAQALKDSMWHEHYRIGCMWYGTKDWQLGRIFLSAALKNFNFEENFISQQKSLSYELSSLSFCCQKEGLVKEAKVLVLLCAILHLKCCTPQPPSLLDQWAHLQNTDSAEAKPADEFLKNASILMRSLCPKFSFSVELVPRLLLWELSCYVTHRMKSSDIILNAWQALKALKPAPLTLLEGSVMACHALFSVNDTVKWHEVVSESHLPLFSKVKESEKAVSLCIMATHYYAKFLIMAQSHFDENKSRVEDLPAVYTRSLASVRQPQDVINPNDVCQIKSSFPNLKIEREENLMDVLDTAVDHWNDSLEAGLSSDLCIEHQMVAASGEYLLQSAFLFLLWGHHAGATKSFQVCSKLAKKLNRDDILLQALSGLINTIEVQEEYIKEADELLKRLKDHPKISYLTKVYHTSRAFQALRTNTYSEGVKVLKEMMPFTPTPSSTWCYAYAKLLQAAYSLLPKSKLDENELGDSQSARFALSCCIQNIQEKRLSHAPLVFAALINQALSCSLWLGRLFLRLHMPKQARSYLKPELMLALKLGLATRAAEIICELGFVDLLTENVDDASVKILDLEYILQTNEMKSENAALPVDTSEESDIVFSLPKPALAKSPISNLGASPTLARPQKLFDIPITHEESCMCYTCRNHSVKNIWLMYSRLQAKICMLKYDVHTSHDIYKKSCKAARVILSELPQPLPLQQHQLACTKVYLKLDFVDMLVLYGKDEDALKFNNSTLEELKHLKTYENHLICDAMEQNMCIAEIIERKNKKGTDAEVAVGKQSTCGICLTPQQPASIITTPVGTEKKRKPLKLVETPKGIVPLTSQQFFISKAPIKDGKMFLSDSEDELPSETFPNNRRTKAFRSQINRSKSHYKSSERNLIYQEMEEEDCDTIAGTVASQAKSRVGKKDMPLKEESSTQKTSSGKILSIKIPPLKTNGSTQITKASTVRKFEASKSVNSKDAVFTSASMSDNKLAPLKKTVPTRGAVSDRSLKGLAKSAASIKSDSDCNGSDGIMNGKAGKNTRKEASSCSNIPETRRQTRQRRN